MTPAARRSAGILLHRAGRAGDTQVLLGHMGGPFWARKDARAWSIPKGELLPGEDPLAGAAREFTEELGLPVPDGLPVELDTLRVSGKAVTVFALAADLDVTVLAPGTFTMEWPPHSGQVQEFPEIDRAEWFDLPTAREKIVKGQAPFLDRLGDVPRGPAE
ncbi:NUDIX domain-containing protein [Pseudonocardia sp.]|uniref:NUDIX domain-containing protein n=1 Tax=Pseudonocardia sp. TaxID=60912 RepID=UPI003D0EB8A4